MPKATMTVEEIVSTLKHSNLPSLVAEGTDDLILLRRLEERFSFAGLSLILAGGRGIVLALFDRRSEFSNIVPTLFMVDQDTWIHSGIPLVYKNSDLLVTDGYSIENDLYRDGDLERLLNKSEAELFKKELSAFLKWYALAVSRHLQSSAISIKDHPSKILSDAASYTTACELYPEECYPTEMLSLLEPEYKKYVRGKSLLALLLRHLSGRAREIKHSAPSLLEHGAVANGPLVERIAEWISHRVESRQTASAASA